MQVETVANSQCKFVCNIIFCKKQFKYYPNLIKHLKTRIERSINVQCPFSSCDKLYSNVSSFTGHISKLHKAAKNDNLILNNLLLEKDCSVCSKFLTNTSNEGLENIDYIEVVMPNGKISVLLALKAYIM